MNNVTDTEKYRPDSFHVYKNLNVMKSVFKRLIHFDISHIKFNVPLCSVIDGDIEHLMQNKTTQSVPLFIFIFLECRVSKQYSCRFVSQYR